MADWSADLALALELATAADEITTRRFRAVDLAVRSKPDLTPVSDADTAVESLLRERLRAGGAQDTGGGGGGGGRRPPAPPPPPLDRRPDRRDEELRSRRSGLGDAARARGGRRH